MSTFKATSDTLNRLVEFDCPFSVDERGNVTDRLEGVHAPDLLDDELSDPRWSFWSTGYTGQDSYSGPVMHNSEQLAGGMARDLLAEPGTYCLVVAYWSPEDESDQSGPDAEGWAVVQLKAGGKASLNCPECKEEIWDLPRGHKLAKCWNAEGHQSGAPFAFDTMGDDDDSE